MRRRRSRGAGARTGLSARPLRPRAPAARRRRPSASICSDRASASAVVGPAIVSRPRSSSTMAASRAPVARARRRRRRRRLERQRRDERRGSPAAAPRPRADARSRRGAPRGRELREDESSSPRRRRISSSARQEARRHQGVVQLVGVARIGPRLVAHARDRVGVERAEIVRPPRRRAASAPRGCAAPRAAHRRGRRRAWRRGSRARTPTARACRARRAAARRGGSVRARRAGRRSPSPLRGSRGPSG